MKKMAIVVLLGLFVLNGSCGSSTASSDTTPREAKVIALTGTLMALASNISAARVVFESIGAPDSGTIDEPMDTIYSNLGLEGTSDDTLVIDSGSWTKTTDDDTTTITLTGISYSSEMTEYPWNNTTPLAGATVSFDDIDFTVTASTDSNGINGSVTTATLVGTGSLDDLTPTDYTTESNNIDIGTMTVNILEPSEKTGTVTFISPTFEGSIYNGEITASTILTAAVEYEGSIYSCTIIAGYYQSEGDSGNTGIGELTVTSATCTDE